MNPKAQRAIVIGGNSGIGMAAAKALCESGLEVVVTGRDETKLEAARQTLRPQGKAERVDATLDDAVRAFFERAGRHRPGMRRRPPSSLTGPIHDTGPVETSQPVRDTLRRPTTA
jgi:NAD(P)-dependent dehydrogenase (short-subunit alcohol dehydrogenase family)